MHFKVMWVLTFIHFIYLIYPYWKDFIIWVFIFIRDQYILIEKKLMEKYVSNTKSLIKTFQIIFSL